MRNAVFVENGYAEIALSNKRITTHKLRPNRYIWIDKGPGRDVPQLCVGARSTGATLVYSSDEQLAKDCDADLYKTREEFEAACARFATP